MPTETEIIIEELKDKIVDSITNKLKKTTPGKIDNDLAISWKQMQDDSVQVIIDLLKKYLKDSTITPQKSKSTYPDIKIENSEGVFAIDIKVNEDTKQPWFDMARLDTIKAERLRKYIEEWELIIKWRTSDGAFIKAYFCLFREAVGKRFECDGVKYRPYDGKIRPKSWKDFDNNRIFWKSKEELIQGIDRSIKHRWKENIKLHLIPHLNQEEKDEFKNLFEEDQNDTPTLFQQ